jgi:hypothetical protein
MPNVHHRDRIAIIKSHTGNVNPADSNMALEHCGQLVRISEYVPGAVV